MSMAEIVTMTKALELRRGKPADISDEDREIALDALRLIVVSDPKVKLD